MKMIWGKYHYPLDIRQITVGRALLNSLSNWCDLKGVSNGLTPYITHLMNELKYLKVITTFISHQYTTINSKWLGVIEI